MADTLNDVLRRAHATLEDESQPFRISPWNECLCGHITAAVLHTTPRELSEGKAVAANHDNQDVRAVYEAIVDRLGREASPRLTGAHVVVSDELCKRYNDDATPRTDREIASQMVRDLIEAG
jgi:hypothetical protein